jgi:hypothetical protein
MGHVGQGCLEKSDQMRNILTAVTAADRGFATSILQYRNGKMIELFSKSVSKQQWMWAICGLNQVLDH